MQIILNQTSKIPLSINTPLINEAIDKFILSKKFLKKTELKKIEITNKYYLDKIKQYEHILNDANNEENKLRRLHIEMDKKIFNLLQSLRDV